MEQYKTFFITFGYTKLNLNNINNPVLKTSSSSDKIKVAKEKVVAPICGEIAFPKESIKKQNVTNGPKFITQS